MTTTPTSSALDPAPMDTLESRCLDTGTLNMPPAGQTKLKQAAMLGCAGPRHPEAQVGHPHHQPTAPAPSSTAFSPLNKGCCRCDSVHCSSTPAPTACREPTNGSTRTPKGARSNPDSWPTTDTIHKSEKELASWDCRPWKIGRRTPRARGPIQQTKNFNNKSQGWVPATVPLLETIHGQQIGTRNSSKLQLAPEPTSSGHIEGWRAAGRNPGHQPS